MQTFWKGNTFSMATDLGAPIPNVGCPHNCHLSAPSQGVPCQLEGTVRPWEHISFETNDFPWCGRQALLQGLQWWFTNSILFVVFFFITKVVQACYKQSRHGELYKEKCNSGPIFFLWIVPSAPRPLRNDLSYFPCAHCNAPCGCWLTALQFLKPDVIVPQAVHWNCLVFITASIMDILGVNIHASNTSIF